MVPRGTPSSVELSGQRDWTWLLGAITKDGDRLFSRFTESVIADHAKHFILALYEEFKDSLAVVPDGAPYFHASAVTDLTARDDLAFVTFPAYNYLFQSTPTRGSTSNLVPDGYDTDRPLSFGWQGSYWIIKSNCDASDITITTNGRIGCSIVEQYLRSSRTIRFPMNSAKAGSCWYNKQHTSPSGVDYYNISIVISIRVTGSSGSSNRNWHPPRL